MIEYESALSFQKTQVDQGPLRHTRDRCAGHALYFLRGKPAGQPADLCEGAEQGGDRHQHGHHRADDRGGLSGPGGDLL